MKGEINMLLKCPECELQVSDKALTCPHCGYPLTKSSRKKEKRKKYKRRRLPNGFGQISELKYQNLRKPFRAMISVGKKPNGRPMTKTIGYYNTYNDAYTALVEYHKNPYDLQADTFTVEQLYEKWTNYYFQTLKSASSVRTISAAWSYCSSIYDMSVKDVRARHIKGCIENGVAVVNGEERHASTNIKSRIKSLFNLMFDYALEYEIVDKNYARTFKISNDIIKEEKENYRGHIPFSEEEMKLLWENINTVPYADIILIQCYSGWRPQELGLLKIENVDLEEWTFTGGMKTEAGINRIVPIHPKIRNLIKAKYKEAVELKSEYLINCVDSHSKKQTENNLKMTYDKYQKRFTKIRDNLKLNPLHRPHDGRMHFVTMAKKYSVDEYAIKYIVGHSITDITEKVYTKRNINWLASEIQKIK